MNWMEKTVSLLGCNMEMFDTIIIVVVDIVIGYYYYLMYLLFLFLFLFQYSLYSHSLIHNSYSYSLIYFLYHNYSIQNHLPNFASQLPHTHRSTIPQDSLIWQQLWLIVWLMHDGANLICSCGNTLKLMSDRCLW